MGKSGLLFVPTYYANDYLGKKVENNEYLKEIGAELDPSIDVLWTGKFVVSPTITVEDAQKFFQGCEKKAAALGQLSGKRLFPIRKGNGLAPECGPFSGRSPELPELPLGVSCKPDE